MSQRPLFLDMASTTPVASAAIEAMLRHLGAESCYFNPASTSHAAGQAAAADVERYRAAIAEVLGCDAAEVVFTSGATEANNLALRGIAQAHAQHGRHLVTSQIEHKSVLATCQALEQAGFDVTYLQPDASGRISAASVKAALRPDTLLVSLHHTNNETGVMQPLAEIADLLADAGVLLHVDAAQAAGKLPLDLNQLPIDLLSLSAHKFHGPKGMGCLVIRNRRHLRLQPLLTGGGQEFGLRPGTLSTHQIAAMAVSLQLAHQQQAQHLAHVTRLKQQFVSELAQQVAITLHADQAHTSPYIVNFAIAGIRSDALLNQLATEVALSSGSACASGTIEPSYVLRAMGIEGPGLYGAVRASFSRDHTVADISLAVERIVAAVRRMQELNA